MSRVLWPSSPSIGWASGVDRLTGLPNGSPAGLVPKKTLAGEPEGLVVDDSASCQFQADVDYNTNIIVRGMGCSACLAKVTQVVVVGALWFCHRVTTLQQTRQAPVVLSVLVTLLVKLQCM